MTSTDASKLKAQLNTVLNDLLDATNASRTTIRIDLPDCGLEPSRPTAEAKRPEISSILDQVRTNMDKSGTINFMKRERRLLIQDDLLHPDDNAQPPTELIQVYGTYAQMLGPIFRDDRLAAWISVHENTGARHWEQSDIEALETAVARASTIPDTMTQAKETL